MRLPYFEVFVPLDIEIKRMGYFFDSEHSQPFLLILWNQSILPLLFLKIGDALHIF
jgi:hypothetical protein